MKYSKQLFFINAKFLPDIFVIFISLFWRYNTFLFYLKGPYVVWLGLKRSGKTTDFVWDDGTFIEPFEHHQHRYENFDENNTFDSSKNILKPDSNYDCGWFGGLSAIWEVSKCDSEFFVICKW